MSKITQILYIVSGPCMVHSKLPKNVLSSSTKCPLYYPKSLLLFVTLKFPEKFTYTIISCSRRGLIKTANIFSQNYKYSGHNLDTITAQFFPSRKELLAAFIVPILYTCGHKKPTVQKKIFYNESILGLMEGNILCKP